MLPLIYLKVELSCACNYVLQMEHRNVIDFYHKQFLLGAFKIFIYFDLLFKNNLYAQCGAWIYNPKTKSFRLHNWASQVTPSWGTLSITSLHLLLNYSRLTLPLHKKWQTLKNTFNYFLISKVTSMHFYEIHIKRNWRNPIMQRKPLLTCRWCPSSLFSRHVFI